MSENQQELIVSKKILSIPQRFATGPVMGRFLAELRDNKRIMANKCPKCGRHQLPPREVCAACRVPADIWEEVGPEGEIRAFDLVYYASPDPLTGKAREVPYTTCYILLDGCKGNDTLWHELNETDPKKVKAGVRVKAVFNEERTGSVKDIKYFEIIMNKSEIEKDRAFVVQGEMALPYQYFAGKVGSKFLVALRDEKKVLGIKCDKCNKVLIPPRTTCERCFSDLSDNWVELGTNGIITGFTIIRYTEPHQPKNPPYILAMIKLEGADTPIAHIVEGVDLDDVRIGMEVRAVFAEERKATIMDIDHFESV